ncbi:hypothetical protein RINTHH_16440 [Richelia intracellularis HH01]|uniref:Peptidase M50 n=1 Tax=Richelia intracellularis HH01 TaxID=1165094 RepID=M1WT50_9NOST|nr:M50 family metallopeptidase [Richelia intracellularis]CCH67799.1 hypothetical protein RINTHH_16440 [Richelia intracellularis HH01]
MRKLGTNFGFFWLIAAALVTVFLWQVPAGAYILYPFTILATWFHEMGHGLVAMILGGDFQKLQIYGNGSGVAFYSGRLYLGSVGKALVAAGGPMGPPAAGAVIILASRNLYTASICLRILGSLLLFSVLMWIRSPFGIITISLLGIITLIISLKAAPQFQIFTTQFLGVQACISTYHQLSYLFSSSAGNLGLSDTAQIQKYLFLPYWFWGGLMSIVSFLILLQSLRTAYNNS